MKSMNLYLLIGALVFDWYGVPVSNFTIIKVIWMCGTKETMWKIITIEVWQRSLLGQLVLNIYLEKMLLFIHCSAITIYNSKNLYGNFLCAVDDDRDNLNEKQHNGFTPFKF